MLPSFFGPICVIGRPFSITFVIFSHVSVCMFYSSRQWLVYQVGQHFHLAPAPAALLG
jgi:hypothetical protein